SLESPFCISSTAIHYESPMTFSIVIMVGRGYFLPTHVHEASIKIAKSRTPRRENRENTGLRAMRRRTGC
ncbi:MAG: hypothetical protein ACOX74_07035, partial [Lachnospiraceae bacterium]